MLERFGFRIQLVLIAAMAAAGLCGLLQLPDGARVPVHFDLHGEADGWSSAGIGLFMLPLLGLLLLGLQRALPYIDPKGDNLRRSAKALATIWLALTLVLALLQAHIVALSLGLSHAMPRLPLVLMGGMYVAIGNVLGKLRPNFSVGIRTPWTLSNERVWDQTHRFGGKVFVLVGALLLALSLAPLPASWTGPAIVVAGLGAALAAVLKSYWLWRSLQP